MRLRTRYLLSLLALVALMMVPAVYGVARIGDLRAIAVELRHDAARSAAAAGRMSRTLAELDRHQRAWVATADPELRDYVARALDALEADGLPLPALPALRAVADSLDRLVRAGELDAATAYLGDVAHPLLADADDAVARLSDAIDRGTAARVADADRIAAAAVRATTLAIALALLAAGVLAWLAARLLSRPLERLGAAMSSVTSGRIEPPTDASLDRDDEVGDLFRAFQSMAWRLVQLDRMKAELVGLASHDLKTPISVITGYTELLEEARDDLDGRHRAVLTSLQEQARSLADRLDQLIEISRMEARGLRLGLEEIHVRHFAAGLETALAPTALRHGVDLAVSVAPDAPTFVVADPDCLRGEIMDNLAGHAFKFSPRGGVVRIELRGGGPGRLEIEVRDQGPPVPAHLSRHLFDRYYRGPAAGRVGSGVALPIARAGIDAHGGAIRVTSGDDGTRFTVSLPVRPGAGADSGARDRARSATGTPAGSA